MSLSEQTARVAGSGKNTLKILLQKLGVPVGDVPIDQYPALAQTISGNLNPDKLLNPSTSQLYGEESDAGPDDLFQAIYYAMYGSPEVVYRWSRIKTTYAGEQSELITSYGRKLAGYSADATVAVAYASSYQINADGTFRLINPTVIRVPANSDNRDMSDQVAGMYFDIERDGFTDDELNRVLFLNRADSTFQFDSESGNGNFYVRFKNFYDITAIPTVHSEIVTSSSPDTYPVPGDGWTYTSLASVQSSAGFAKIEYGTYVGSGVYGQSNPNQLTFTFPPKMVCIGGEQSALPFIQGSRFGRGPGSDSSYVLHLTWEGKNVSWYSETSEYTQMNVSDNTYYYVALG